MAAFSTLQDDFSSGSINPALWSTSGDGASVVSGQLNIVTIASGSGLGVVYSANYDLTSSYIYVQFISASNVFSYGQFGFSYLYDSVSGNSVGWYFDGSGNIYAGASDLSSSAGTLSPTTHYYLRIRESGGTIYWDYSTNASSWTNLYSKTWSSLFSSITSLNLNMIAFGHGSDGTLILDNVNTAPPLPTTIQTTKSRIQATVSKTQTTKSRIRKTLSATQTTKSRVQIVTSATQPTKSRISNSVSKTQTTKSHIVISRTATQTTKSNILTSQTVSTDLFAYSFNAPGIKTTVQFTQSRIQNTVSTTQTTKSNIVVPFIATTTQTTVSHIVGSFLKVLNITLKQVSAIALSLVTGQGLNINLVIPSTIDLSLTTGTPIDLGFKVPAAISNNATVPAPIELTLIIPAPLELTVSN